MKHKNDQFHKQYQKLNSQQKEAVDTIEGPVMVIAGPGTGKTQILTLRIAHILRQTQANPGNILALTFTQAAALNMRERLLNIIGSDAYRVNIFTFHAFCAFLIEQNPDDFWDILGMKLADEVQKVQILEGIFDTHSFSHIKPFGKPHHYVKDALGSFSELKREGVSPEELKILIDQERLVFESTPNKESKISKGKLKTEFQKKLKNIEKNNEILTAYSAYQRALREVDLYDYDDLIMSVLGKLQRDEDFRLRQMEHYQYILVDEHQDSNNAQNKIIQLLTSFHKNPNIFVVGDEKQAIFRFQGASVENFRKFTKLYPGAKLITLTNNYRSTQTILDNAIELLDVPEQKLTAHAGHTEKPIRVMIADTIGEELQAVASEIKKLIQDGTAPHELAVLVRKRAHIAPIAQALVKADVPVLVMLEEDVFKSEVVQTLLTMLEAVEYYAQEEYLFQALHLKLWDVNPLDLYTLTQSVSRRRIELSHALADMQVLQKIGINDPEKLHTWFVRLGQWYLKSKEIPCDEFIHTVVEESGLLKHILACENPIFAVAPLRELYDNIALLDIEHMWKLTDFFTYVEKMRKHNISLKVKIKTDSAGKVQLMTTHGAKGLEFDHVFIPHVQDSVWGGRKKPKLITLPDAVYEAEAIEDHDPDERRLFFVALTRARKQVHISYAKTRPDGAQALPSPYLEDIKPELMARSDVPSMQLALAPSLSSQKMLVDSFNEFVRATFSQYGLSVSALNNYIQCPWKYFYVNLVRVPSGKDKVLMFGNAVHNALTYFFSHYKESGEKSCDYLLSAFEKSAQREQFTKMEINDALVRGKQILMDYFKTYEDTFSRNIQVKVRIPEVQHTLQENAFLSSVKLTGEVDMVEYMGGSLQTVSVIDFKTGKPKSRNDIMGKTKYGDGNYFRQLVFYKLLLKHFRPTWNMQSGVLDFVQSDDKGKYHREIFDIADEDVQTLEKSIQTAVTDILSLGFWERFCDDPDCQWCHLRKSLDAKEFEGGLF